MQRNELEVNTNLSKQCFVYRDLLALLELPVSQDLQEPRLVSHHDEKSFNQLEPYKEEENLMRLTGTIYN